MYTVTRDGDTLCVRASIDSLKESKAFIAKIEEMSEIMWAALEGPELAKMAEKSE